MKYKSPIPELPTAIDLKQSFSLKEQGESDAQKRVQRGYEYLLDLTLSIEPKKVKEALSTMKMPPFRNASPKKTKGSNLLRDFDYREKAKSAAVY